jgi:hypothetical protein
MRSPGFVVSALNPFIHPLTQIVDHVAQRSHFVPHFFEFRPQPLSASPSSAEPGSSSAAVCGSNGSAPAADGSWSLATACRRMAM